MDQQFVRCIDAAAGWHTLLCMVFMKGVTMSVRRFGDGYMSVGRDHDFEKRGRDLSNGRDDDSYRASGRDGRREQLCYADECDSFVSLPRTGPYTHGSHSQADDQPEQDYVGQ